MDQQSLFNFYTYFVVGILAQSILAWELGTKGWDIALPKNAFRPRVVFAILLFVVQVIWYQLAKLEFPIQSIKQTWPVLFPVLIFVYAKLRLKVLSMSSDRLANFMRAKKLYYNYANRIKIPFEQLTEVHFKRGLADTSLQEAEELYKNAISLSIAEDQHRDAAIAKYQLGMLYHIQGRKTEARRLFNKAIKTLESFQHDEESIGTMAGCYYHLGILAEKEKKLINARNFYKKSYELETSIGEIRDAYASKVGFERCGGVI